MTERLYYHDSFAREFDARVLSCSPAGEGRYHAVLDCTLFYPASGGQPCDTGVLGPARVLEVADGPGGGVIHVVDRPLPAGRVRGAVDWPRRFDHMQQHTGQHLLSAAFIELFAMQTVSFHLGAEVSTIDLHTRALAREQMERAEARVNEIICEDRPVRVRFLTAAELDALGARKKVEREGLLRVLEIEGYDRQPCGGTHVARTGQVGAVLLRRWEKQKQNWRVEFVCGRRAVRAARADYAALGEAARVLGCAPEAVAGLVRRALEERKALDRERRMLWERLAEAETAAGGDAGPRVVRRLYGDEPPDFLRHVATRFAAQPGVAAVIAGKGSGQVVIARHSTAPGDAGTALRQALAAAGGKGGGNAAFAQGTAPPGTDWHSLLEHAAALLQHSS